MLSLKSWSEPSMDTVLMCGVSTYKEATSSVAITRQYSEIMSIT